jgi:flagellar motility protein MotE (MotC chaperone)
MIIGFIFFQNDKNILTQIHAATAAQNNSENSQNSDKKITNTPSIPNGPLSISEASKIRMSLETLKAEVEQKITTFEEQKKLLVKTKQDIAAEKKFVENEKKLLDSSIQKEKEVQQQRLSESLEIIVKMEPKKAASVLESLDRDLVIQLIKKLPAKQATKIFENLNAKKAAEYMEYYTRIKSGREYALLKELGLCPSEKNEEVKN